MVFYGTHSWIFFFFLAAAILERVMDFAKLLFGSKDFDEDSACGAFF